MKSGICAIGDNVVDRYQESQEMFPGGNAVNVAVHAKRNGIRSAYIGVIGTDTAAQLVAKSLRDENVLTSHMRVVEGPNAWAAVSHKNGDRYFLGSDKGVSKFKLNDSDYEYLSEFEIAHIGYSGGMEEQLAEISKSTQISYDFADKSRSYVVPLIKYCTIATFSIGEQNLEVADEIIEFALSNNVDTILVTRGKSGAVVADKKGKTILAAKQIEAIDTLGAGDAFIAAYLAARLKKIPRDEAIISAVNYSAEVCLQHGAYGYRSMDNLPKIDSQKLQDSSKPTWVNQ